MKAVLSHTPGGPESLVLEDVDSPDAGDDQVVVDVKAVGINFPDGLIIADLYQFRPDRPFAPGGEISGVVSSVGSGVDSLSVGDRVLSMIGWGGLVEQIAVDAKQCIAIPDEMPDDVAAGFLFAFGTSHYALLNRGQLAAGDTLLVLGAAGGVGLAAVQIGKAVGARVIAACSTQEKVDLCIENGADAGIVYPANPLDREQRKAFSTQIKEAGGRGVDVVCDVVGGDYAEPAIRTMAWHGRYLVVGFPAGIPSIPLNLVLLKSCQIVGVFFGSFSEVDPVGFSKTISELFALYADGGIRPHISATYPLDRAGEAISELMDRRATGKVVVTV